MPRIRHIAIGTQDPEATARFYIEGLGLKQVGKLNSQTAEGYYLSDGHVNLAILKFKHEEPAITEGAARYTGVHHFGLEVDDMKKARARFEKAGAVHRPYPGTAEMEKRGNVEVKFSGPDGVTIDLSEHGWLGTKGATPKRVAKKRRR
jgi:catechol 2,3-dioxygenase-like lactoylglutathione lyase family enzyme